MTSACTALERWETITRDAGAISASSIHTVDVYTAKQAFDPHGSDYQMDEYETADAFGT